MTIHVIGRCAIAILGAALVFGTAFAQDVPGNFTIGGYLGIGTTTPVRAVHLVGPNAVFRMDRSTDTAAFFMVRIDTAGNPLKCFQVGTNSSGSNQGEFMITDMGTAVGGGGQRRMTITNTGATIFTGSVSATEYFVTSSRRFKENIRTLDDPIAKIQQLRGVLFDWKATSAPSLGLIAEEVAQVAPEAVSWDPAHKDVVGVNYNGLLAILVEASKAQQADIERLDAEIDQLTTEVRRELSRTAGGASDSPYAVKK